MEITTRTPFASALLAQAAFLALAAWAMGAAGSLRCKIFKIHIGPGSGDGIDRREFMFGYWSTQLGIPTDNVNGEGETDLFFEQDSSCQAWPDQYSYFNSNKDVLRFWRLEKCLSILALVLPWMVGLHFFQHHHPFEESTLIHGMLRPLRLVFGLCLTMGIINLLLLAGRSSKICKSFQSTPGAGDEYLGYHVQSYSDCELASGGLLILFASLCWFVSGLLIYLAMRYGKPAGFTPIPTHTKTHEVPVTEMNVEPSAASKVAQERRTPVVVRV